VKPVKIVLKMFQSAEKRAETGKQNQVKPVKIVLRISLFAKNFVETEK